MPNNDFNGDGKSDILWILGGSNPTGLSYAVTNWLASSSGAFVRNDAAAYNNLSAWDSYKLVATGDFNGDGRTDVLWNVDDLGFQVWNADANGGLPFQSTGNWFDRVDGWSIVGSGDFNGDGIADLLWRSTDGRLGDWLGVRGGGFTVNSASIVAVDSHWQVAGTGDFDGDGKSDILWASDTGLIGNWLGTASGGFHDNSADSLFEGDPREIQGVGDFNGDGRDDLLMRDDRGDLGVMLTFAGGAFYPQWGSGFVAHVPLDWKVAAIGDYDGNGTDDVLWQNDNGAVGSWLSSGDGYHFAIRDGASLYQVSSGWQVADMLI